MWTSTPTPVKRQPLFQISGFTNLLKMNTHTAIGPTAPKEDTMQPIVTNFPLARIKTRVAGPLCSGSNVVTMYLLFFYALVKKYLLHTNYFVSILDTYNETRKKIPTAVRQSDLSSAEESAVRRKRISIPNRPYSPSMYENQDSRVV